MSLRRYTEIRCVHRHVSAPFPQDHAGLRISSQTPGKEGLRQCQQSPSPAHHVLSTSYCFKCGKGKIPQTLLRKTVHGLKLQPKAAICSGLLESKPQMEVSSPSPAGCPVRVIQPDITALSQFHLVALPRQLRTGSRCCCSKGRKRHSWGPARPCPSRATSAPAPPGPPLSGALPPPFDPGAPSSRSLLLSVTVPGFHQLRGRQKTLNEMNASCRSRCVRF